MKETWAPSPEHAEDLKNYLHRDYWRVRDALCLLLGIHPEETRLGGNTPSRLVFLDGRKRLSTVAQEFEARFRMTRELWLGTNHSPKTGDWQGTQLPYFDLDHSLFSVNYFLRWAISKGLKIDWLTWAADNNLLPDEFAIADTSSVSRRGHLANTPDHRWYSSRLAILNEMWVDLYLNGGRLKNESHLDAVTRWLKERGYDFGPTVIKELARMMSPNKVSAEGRNALQTG